MLPLLRWGLPDRSRDDLLFGGGPAWPAQRYAAEPVARARREQLGAADADLNPLPDRSRPVLLTADDGARAEILRRYRLFTRQPDEMITLMALQRMQPRKLDFDPRLYQYGGGYIYLVGALLMAAGSAGLVDLSDRIAIYLEQPERLAGVYLSMRLVSLVFGGLLLVGVWKLAARAAGRAAGWLAMLFLACTPVFFTGVLEAKPHVPAACMVVWATLSALDYHARGRTRDLVRLGVQAGYAFSLVLSGIVSLVPWVVLGLRRRGASLSARRELCRLLAGLALALGVYLATNPYVLYHALRGGTSLQENLSNSIAMYTGQMRRAAAGAVRVAELLLESCGLGALVVGAAGTVWLLRRQPSQTLLASSGGVAMLAIAILLGAGKPAEYARFLVLPVALLCTAAAAALAFLSRQRRAWAVGGAVLVLVMLKTPAYVSSFLRDVRGTSESRRLAGQYLRDHVPLDAAIAVLQEPAPYAIPPMDFTRREVIWLPAARPADLAVQALPAWLVFSADDERVWRGAWWLAYYELVARFPSAKVPLSRIAWADKPVFIWQRLRMAE